MVFISGGKGGWKCSLDSDAALKLYRQLEVNRARQVRVSSGGSLLNSAKTFAQLGVNPTIVIPYELDGRSHDQIFKNFSGHELVSLKTESDLPKGEVDKLTVNVFTYKGDTVGERFLLSLDNDKIKYPTLSQREWIDKLQLSGDAREIESIVIEGFPFYANIESFTNLMSAAKGYGIPVVFCLSNAFKLSVGNAAENILKLIIDEKYLKL